MPRPLSVTLLALAVLCLAAFNVLGAVTSLQRYAFLSGLPLTAPLPYLVATHVIWATAFGALAFGLWRLKHWGRLGTLGAVTMYVAQSWLHQLFFEPTDFVRAMVPYTLTMTIIFLTLVWGLLWWRPVYRSFST